MIFNDRFHAGKILAQRLLKLKLNLKNTTVAAIPRGGVAVAVEVAETLGVSVYPLVIKKDSKIKRDRLIYFLEKENIETRYLMPLLSQPIYKKLFGNIEENYPVAKWIDKNGFYIGCHQELKRSDLDYVIYTFEKFFQKKG